MESRTGGGRRCVPWPGREETRVTHIVYVDETKAGNYLLAVAVVPRVHAGAATAKVRGLLLPGERSLHMKSQHRSRRGDLAAAIAGLREQQVQVTILDAGRHGTEKERRRRCLEGLVQLAAREQAAHVRIDLDRTLAPWDRQQMVELVRRADATDRLTYDHCHRHDDLLLAVPDVAAWCWAHGGDLRQAIRPLVPAVRRLG